MSTPQERETEQPVSFDSSQIKRRLTLVESKSENFVTKDYFEKTIGDVKEGILLAANRSDVRVEKAIGEMKIENAKITGKVSTWAISVLVGIILILIKQYLYP